MRNIILILILLLLTIYYFKNRQEYFTLIGDHKINEKQVNNSRIIYDKWKHLTINNKRPLTFNQNWNKIWLGNTKSNKSTVVQDIPHINDNAVPSEHTLVNMFTGDEIKQILENMVKKELHQNNQKYISVIANPKKIEEMNKKSWKDRINLYNPDDSNNKYPIVKYPIDIVNKILIDYLTKVNNIVKEKYKSKINKFGYIPFQIYKYKLVNIEESKNKTRRYSIILVMLRDINVSRGFTIFLQYIVNKNGIINLESYDLIGIFYTDQLLMIKGNAPDYSEEDLSRVYKPITLNNVNKILDKEVENIKQFDISNQYNCFNINKNDPKNTIIMANNKHNCEDKYDFFGRLKPYGYWDKPCKSDKECPYRNANRNYPNNLGKCNNGYCEFPIGIKPIGYHNYYKDTKPLCYNCNSKSWKATTTLGDCCDKQKDKSKYPFLNSPDYAFKNDIFQRVNAYYKKSGCYTKHNYKNIFTNEIENSEVICPK